MEIMRRYQEMNAIRLRLLLAIYARPRSTLDDLEQLTGLKRNATISNLRVLEAHGLVAKQRGRKMRYRLTLMGEEIVKKIKTAKATQESQSSSVKS
ncbi:hypothetical protein HS1genome_1001 [Sulfodiicoccus acidiphilus]|uniref:HTH marR-type domain-containing protein n=2 Tax=Sulfodiicoccus acidiphilus TaxID=1670455 RepID=A0A348B360_9CREN|nr:hypothetical protein HS1genome_1001 [Sulfodiicoccus acidiphilus]GGT93336.1 hypothetical protein GCM10007116_08750 [Sulfodiicoccus acidiphilus]